MWFSKEQMMFLLKIPAIIWTYKDLHKLFKCCLLRVIKPQLCWFYCMENDFCKASCRLMERGRKNYWPILTEFLLRIQMINYWQKFRIHPIFTFWLQDMTIHQKPQKAAWKITATSEAPLRLHECLPQFERLWSWTCPLHSFPLIEVYSWKRTGIQNLLLPHTLEDKSTISETHRTNIWAKVLYSVFPCGEAQDF